MRYIMHIYTKKQNEMNKTFTFKDSPPPLMSIHIDDISNVEPVNTNILPQMKEGLLEVNVKMTKDSMHIVMPATSSHILSIGTFFSIGKTLMEMGDTDIQYDGGEKTLDMYYNAFLGILYWDISHTHRVSVFKINSSPLIQKKIEGSLINALSSHIIFYDDGVMLMDAHVECDAVMGRITRICDMISYEISPIPHIQKNSFLYESSGDGYYISILKI